MADRPKCLFMALMQMRVDPERFGRSGYGTDSASGWTAAEKMPTVPGKLIDLHSGTGKKKVSEALRLRLFSRIAGGKDFARKRRTINNGYGKPRTFLISASAESKQNIIEPGRYLMGKKHPPPTPGLSVMGPGTVEESEATSIIINHNGVKSSASVLRFVRAAPPTGANRKSFLAGKIGNSLR